MVERYTQESQKLPASRLAGSNPAPGIQKDYCMNVGRKEIEEELKEVEFVHELGPHKRPSKRDNEKAKERSWLEMIQRNGGMAPWYWPSNRERKEFLIKHGIKAQPEPEWISKLTRR